MRKIYLTENQIRKIAESMNSKLSEGSLYGMVSESRMRMSPKRTQALDNKAAIDAVMASTEDEDTKRLYDFWFNKLKKGGNAEIGPEEKIEMVDLSYREGLISSGVRDNIRYGRIRNLAEIAPQVRKAFQRKHNKDYVSNTDSMKSQGYRAQSIRNAGQKDGNTRLTFNTNIRYALKHSLNHAETLKFIETEYTKYKLDVRDAFIRQHFVKRGNPIMSAMVGTQSSAYDTSVRANKAVENSKSVASFFLNKKSEYTFQDITDRCRARAERLKQEIKTSTASVGGYEFDVVTLVDTTNQKAAASFVDVFTSDFSKNTDALSHINSLDGQKVRYKIAYIKSKDNTPIRCVPMHHNDPEEKEALVSLFAEVYGVSEEAIDYKAYDNRVFINGFMLTTQLMYEPNPRLR